MTNFFKEKVELASRDDVVKLHLIIRCYEKGYHDLSRADIDTLFELYKTGYNETFYKNCIDKKYFKTKQTVRNSVAKMTNHGILWYKKKGERFFSEEFIPDITQNKVIIQYLVGNVDDSQA